MHCWPADAAAAAAPHVTSAFFCRIRAPSRLREIEFHATGAARDDAPPPVAQPAVSVLVFLFLFLRLVVTLGFFAPGVDWE